MRTLWIYICEGIKPPQIDNVTNKAWWMGESTGKFTMKSAWESIRTKNNKREVYKQLWIKGLPFKINFFLWKVWRDRISTDDNLTRMEINMVSKYYTVRGVYMKQWDTCFSQHLQLRRYGNIFPDMLESEWKDYTCTQSSRNGGIEQKILGTNRFIMQSLH